MRKNPKYMADRELMTVAKDLVTAERRGLILQIRVFAEIVRRGLHFKAGYENLFNYLVKELGLSRGCAHKRNVIARTSRQFPEVLELLEKGRLTIATAAVVAREINDGNKATLLALADGRSEDELEILVAQMKDAPIVRDTVRVIGVRQKPHELVVAKGTDATRPTVQPISVSAPPPEEVIVKISFGATKDLSDKIEALKGLLSRRHPDGRLADVIETAIDEFISRHNPARKVRGEKESAGENSSEQEVQPTGTKSETDSPTKTQGQFTRELKNTGKSEANKRVRFPNAALRRLVFRRDGNRCTYVNTEGTRCGSTRWLEVDHIQPFALGGRTEFTNLRLLCSHHNKMRARETFG